VKRTAIAAVVERVEDEPHQVVALPDDTGIAAHLVGHESRRFAFPASERDMDVVPIEGDPRLGPLRGRLALVRLGLEKLVIGGMPA
jgi:hypothetical protein